MIQTQSILTGNVPVCVAPVADSPGRVRQWELVEFVAQGSLAGIYRARPVGTPADRPATYAVKMLRPCWQNDPDAIRLLRREAVVGPPSGVMPWLAGASLQARLAAGQQFDVPKTLWIARQAAEALDALHAAGWIHGDVTPGNIHVSPSGHVTLIDLSFARRGDELGSAADRPIMGTCSFIAPELFTSALRADIRSDLYSLGVVLFEMLSGRLPYPGTDLAELATQYRQSSPAELARLAPHIPREVVALVQRLIAHEPLRRPQSPRELIERLISLEVGTFSQRTV